MWKQLFILTVFIHNIVQALVISDIYVDDPKKAINDRWESIHFIVHENQEWRRTMESDRVRKRFVESMMSIPRTVIVTPPTAVKIIDETPYCWAILAYDSNNDHNLKGQHWKLKPSYPYLYSILAINKLGNALSDVFYERCGVGLLDLGYPSNYATFGKIVESTPTVIMRFADHHHEMFNYADLHHERHHIAVQGLGKWGTIAPPNLLGNIIISTTKIPCIWRQV